MAKKFVDSGLIEQESEGHCSIASVSKCTLDKVRAYFTKGEVPPHPVEGGKGRELEDGKWDRCEADEWPWHPYQEAVWLANRGVEATQEAEVMTAWKEMQETTKDWTFWGNSVRKWGLDYGVVQGGQL